MDSPRTDWSLIQSFLAVAETGSLSAAARRLSRSQPTLGRHIRALEADLGASLFDRRPRGLELTETGRQLLPMAQDMHAQMHAISLAAAGRSQRLEGTVRITASVFVSHYILPPVLAQIRAAEPAIELELVPDDTPGNLLFRAADIAVRMYRPAQLDLVARRIGDLPLGIFAAKSYLARRGRPKTAEELWEHELVGYDENDLILRTVRGMGWPVERRRFATRCDNQAVYWQLVRAGCGIGFSQAGTGRADPAVEELDLGIAIPPLPVWLAAHETMRSTPRVARVWEILAPSLAEAVKG
ncbi:LysR family transcriptional regulator [Roseobacteraceae bacterium NS-SX3]